MEFQSRRLLFRPFCSTDYHSFSTIFSNDQIMQYAYMDQIVEEKEMKAYFNQVLDNNMITEKKSACEFAVFSLSNGCFIGFAVILVRYHFSRIKHGEIGYFLLPEYWGQGYATEIAGKLAEVCFTTLTMHKVVASCNANNQKSEKVMKKLGMRKEGEFRKERYKNGQWDNELFYGLLIEEWKEMQSSRQA